MSDSTSNTVESMNKATTNARLTNLPHSLKILTCEQGEKHRKTAAAAASWLKKDFRLT